MAKEPSTKRPRGVTSDQTSEVNDVLVPGQKLDYTRCLKEVDLHSKEKMDVLCTSNPDEANKMINRIRKRIGDLYPWYIGVDVEYTREDKPPQRPKGLHPLLKEDKLYTFANFSIEGDKQKLQESGLEINLDKYIDIQRKWRVPFMGRKRFHSLANVARSVIHPFYNNMEKKIDREEDHKLWGISPLPDYLIEYPAIDAYATYESWKKTENIREGLESAKEEEESYDNPYYGYE